MLLNCSVPFLFSLFASVHGPPAAAPDAGQAPARPDLPAARPTETHPPLHFHTRPVFGPPLDPQVHRGCHHLPRHGEEKASPDRGARTETLIRV